MTEAGVRGATRGTPRVPRTVTELRVRYAETDQMGVVYHTHYLVWCEVGRTDHIRRFGMSYADMEREGLSLAVSEASVRFLAPARYDDPIRIETGIVDVRSRTVTFDYLITHGETGQRLATATTRLVALDERGRIAIIPPHMREVLERGCE